MGLLGRDAYGPGVGWDGGDAGVGRCGAALLGRAGSVEARVTADLDKGATVDGRAASVHRDGAVVDMAGGHALVLSYDPGAVDVDVAMIGAPGGCRDGDAVVAVVAARVSGIARLPRRGVSVLGVSVMAAPWFRYTIPSIGDARLLAKYATYVSDGRSTELHIEGSDAYLCLE
jgi:hypothetical protein